MAPLLNSAVYFVYICYSYPPGFQDKLAAFYSQQSWILLPYNLYLHISIFRYWVTLLINIPCPCTVCVVGVGLVVTGESWCQ